MRRVILIIGLLIALAFSGLKIPAKVFAASMETTYEETTNPSGTQVCAITYSVGASYMVTIPKNLVLSGKSVNGVNSIKYAITITADIPAKDAVIIAPQSSVAFSQFGKTDRIAMVSQPVSRFQIGLRDITEERLLEGYSTMGRIEVKNLTAGTWTGGMVFRVVYEEGM